MNPGGMVNKERLYEYTPPQDIFNFRIRAGGGKDVEEMRSVPLLVLLIVLFTAAGCTRGEDSPDNDLAVRAVQETTPVPVQPFPTLSETLILPTASLTDQAKSPREQRSFRFVSGSNEYSFTISVAAPSGSLMTGTSDCPLMSWRTGDEGRLASYYAGIFRDPGEGPLYDALLGEFHRIRRMDGLNDDQYLELLTHFIQQIPYDPEAHICPRRPDQVILDGKGDCDEKSLLLLGLLDQEGYDAAILLFPDKHHATAGIRIVTDGHPSFRVYDLSGRKYVYIETTRPSFIGLYPDNFENENPVIIPTGNGTITYRAINDVMHIVSTQKRMEERLEWINETGTGMLTEIESLESKLTVGTGYSSRDEYDSDYARYAGLVTQYNQYVDEFGKIREVYLYILDHQFDRPGVSGRIANSKVENLL
jgi:hypothetical protein